MDDIVTRLREMTARCWCAEKSQGEPVGKPFFRCESCDDQLRAADEIERLRALCNDLHHDATCTQSFCRLCGEGIQEWEADRG